MVDPSGLQVIGSICGLKVLKPRRQNTYRDAEKRQTPGHTAVLCQKASQAYQRNQCYQCGAVGHKKNECMQARFQMPVCIFFGKIHPSDTPCTTQKNTGVYKASTAQVDYNAVYCPGLFE